MPSRISGSNRPAKRTIFGQYPLLCTRLIYRPTKTVGRADSLKSVFHTQTGSLSKQLTIDQGTRSAMPKRIPPWELAQLNFARQERARLHKLEVEQRPMRDQVLDLQENKKRLDKLRERLADEEKSAKD